MADTAAAGLLLDYVRGAVPQPEKSHQRRVTALGHTETSREYEDGGAVDYSSIRARLRKEEEMGKKATGKCR